MPSEVENKTGHGIVDCINPLSPTGIELLEVVEMEFNKFSNVLDVTLSHISRNLPLFSALQTLDTGEQQHRHAI